MLGRAALPFLIVGLAYYLGCLAGFALRFPLSGISFFWPPTAVLTAALLLARRTTWPGLLISAFAAHGVAHTMDGVPPGAWLIQFTGNSVQAVIAAYCVNRQGRVAHLFPDVRSAVIFIACACLGAPAIASLIPAASYVHLGWATDFRGAWLARTITNSVASMTLVPPLFVTGQFLRAPRVAPPARWAEFILLLLGIAGVHAATAWLTQGTVLGLSAALYAPLPFLLWAVVRFAASGLSFALLWTTLLTIATASRGEGPFIARLSADTVLGVDVFLSGSAILMMLIAGLLEEQRTERRRLIEAGQQNTAIMARLHEAQQRYALATAAGGVGVWELNLRDGAVHIEGGLKRMLGYDDDEIPDDLAGWMRCIAPLDRDEIQARLGAMASDAASTFDAEIRMIHRDGSLRWIASKGAISSRTGGTPTHTTGTYADITERKESERALRDATDALARTWRISAMTEMSAALAHELNQPLTAITTNTNACLRWIDAGAFTADLKGALQDVLQESRRASHIVEGTRDMFASRPTESERLNLNDVVRDIIEIAQPRLRELHIALDLKLDAALPCVIGDAVQVRQVVLNLVLNAAEAMRDASSHRRLSITSRHSRNVVRVSVRDTGRGFTPDDRLRLFEPFYTTKAGGLGMGLAISRSIVHRHDGSLLALMNAGDGSTFRIRMPAAGPQSEAQRSS